jgi:hypothetical protein
LRVNEANRQKYYFSETDTDIEYAGITILSDIPIEHIYGWIYIPNHSKNDHANPLTKKDVNFGENLDLDLDFATRDGAVFQIFGTRTIDEEVKVVAAISGPASYLLNHHTLRLDTLENPL